MHEMTARLTDKIQSLTGEEQIEVERFVESLRAGAKYQTLSRAASSISEPAFAAVWSNPEDDAYDAL